MLQDWLVELSQCDFVLLVLLFVLLDVILLVLLVLLFVKCPPFAVEFLVILLAVECLLRAL